MVKKLALVYAHAHNEINIPVTVFASFDEGYNQLVEIFKYRPPINVNNEKRFSDFAPLAGLVTDFDKERDKNLIKQLFKSYYGGCGDVTCIVLQGINNGEMPLFSFDLD